MRYLDNVNLLYPSVVCSGKPDIDLAQFAIVNSKRSLSLARMLHIAFKPITNMRFLFIGET